MNTDVALHFALGFRQWIGTWYAPNGLASLLLLLGITVFAFYRSLGGRDLLGSEDPSF